MHIFTVLPFLSLAAAHTVFTTLYVDGENQGDGVCVRMNRDPAKATFPVEPLSSRDIACGYDGEKGVARVCPAETSSTLTFEFREYADGSQPGSMDSSHKGPCAVYMKKVDDATADNNAAGDGWFKIWQADYDASAIKWCTEKIIDNNGHLSVVIPENIQTGYYLVRPELLALHSAQEDPPDPQFYVGCAQLFVQSSGTTSPPTVSIGEGTYDLSTSGMTYNIYEDPLPLPYPMYGPPVYQSNGDSNESEVEKSAAMVQHIGLKPEGCVLVRDNWCAFEVPSYIDEQGCWNAAQKCWDQNDECWQTAPPTGGKNCNIWEKKCHALDDSCHQKSFTGPPDAGKDLTPPAPSLNGPMKVFRRDHRRRLHGHA